MKTIRGGTRSQLRRPLFPLGLPLVGHAENMGVSGGNVHMKFEVGFGGGGGGGPEAGFHKGWGVSLWSMLEAGWVYPGGGSLKRFVKVLRLWDFVLSIKMALFERSEFDIFMIAFSKISES